ncbi:histidine kinase [Algoriphagus pacificus]|uniref:Histidine kinase n=1 Tax=Algoriphagus pacificus TaxID=2811234 RepID=A0ABS3CL48_9BACT|nr:histidine kinase [Algoriphagus pacificus]MBN7817485.1 histidine kinase [Algoriphagus pacificus]
MDYPLYYLFLVFFAYWLVDLLATLLIIDRISDWFSPLYNFLSGYFLVALYFRFILPKFKIPNQRGSAILILLLLILVFIGSKAFVYDVALFNGFPRVFIINELLRVFFFLGLTTAIGLQFDKQDLRKKQFEIEMAHEKLQLEHRSMQLSSHFVMNVLSIYASKITLLSRDLAKDFSHFTSLLRYSFQDFEEPQALEDELVAVRNYLQIQKIRFPDISIADVVQWNPIASELPMPKLCLLTLVENVFFHGDYKDKLNPCIIEFDLSLDASSDFWRFTAFISNKVLKRNEKIRSGFGASSVFKILSYQFGDRFGYEVESDDTCYTLKMSLLYDTEFQNRVN